MRQGGAPFVVNPRDPRAPPQDVWDRLDGIERASIVANLPSELPLTDPPEGDLHRIPKQHALSALQEFFRRTRRRIYLSAELPVFYPDEPMFAPDVIAVLDADDVERSSWVVSHEGRGPDLAIEIHVAGDRRRDFEQNVERYARLGISEYLAFDVPRKRLLGWRLPTPTARRYGPIISRAGRWASAVLALDVSVEQGKLRFFHGSAPLLDVHELIAQLSTMVDDAVERAEQETHRAERLAARLRLLGIDPDETE